MSIFATLLLAKMALNVRIMQYGFALAMPAVLGMVAIFVCWIPRETDKYGGNGAVVRAAMIPIFALLVAVHLSVYGRFFHDKPIAVGSGADRFYCGDARGVAVNRMLRELSLLPREATLVSIPEGVMLNYLARRTNPTKYINFMPPEMLMFGQLNILAAFDQHPPDYIVLVLRSDPASYGYKSFAADYGAEVFRWVTDHYITVPTETEPSYPLMLLRRR